MGCLRTVNIPDGLMIVNLGREGEVETPGSGFLYEAGFQADGNSIDLAGDFVIAFHQTNGFGLRSSFEHL